MHFSLNYIDISFNALSTNQAIKAIKHKYPAQKVYITFTIHKGF